MRIIDLTGQRFTRLTVIGRAGSIRGRPAWLCKCDCGNKTIVDGCALRSGNTKTCGCSRKELKPNFKHGDCASRLYVIWSGMLQRCYYRGGKDFKNYGGRGITVCAEWENDYSAFKKWAMSHGYSETFSIDRIDVDGNYQPDNCRWATPKQQANNKRNTKSKEVDEQCELRSTELG